MLAALRRLIPPTLNPGQEPPPTGLAAFYWHFIRQTPWPYLATVLTSLCVALVDMCIPVFIGKVVVLMQASDRTAALEAATWPLLGMLAAILLGRPLLQFADVAIRLNAIIPGSTSLIRWQSHWHVVRQSWPFFQKDFAGRIANRVMQTAQSLRETILSVVRSVLYAAIYGISALILMASSDWRLALPTLCWLLGYAAFLRFFVPRLRQLAREGSEARSQVMGRIVDSYTNILTLKLFARHQDEDAYVQDSLLKLQGAVGRHMGLTTHFMTTLHIMNALLLASTAVIGVLLWARGDISAGVVAMALPLAWQITNTAGWVSFEVAGIFENIGVVQEGMETIAQPLSLQDAPEARDLEVSQGEIRFEHLRFGYGGAHPVLDDLSLTIRPGERVGLVGRSGAGKSTLVNLLLRFYEPEGGHIRIDGQDIRKVTQESLRAAIGMVTQDTSLLHRSIGANIRYGRPQASQAEVEAAARQAEAYDFIQELRDWLGHQGFEAQVGERGVKLSGGQRQRIALARVILKNAPILILDEATSALDSEVENAIQEQLMNLMAGKTVIAIAHRLSTIARMDRLIVLDRGRIVETGSHEELLAANGLYAALWQHQSGGFLPDSLPEPSATHDTTATL